MPGREWSPEQVCAAVLHTPRTRGARLVHASRPQGMRMEMKRHVKSVRATCLLCVTAQGHVNGLAPRRHFGQSKFLMPEPKMLLARWHRWTRTSSATVNAFVNCNPHAVPTDHSLDAARWRRWTRASSFLRRRRLGTRRSSSLATCDCISVKPTLPPPPRTALCPCSHALAMKRAHLLGGAVPS